MLLNEKHSSYLVDNLFEGFAYCQIVLDAHDRFSDLDFLASNPAFAQLTGWDHIAGKRLSQLIPNLQQINPALIQAVRRVAMTGQSEKFEVNAPVLRRWLSVEAYRPEPGYLIMLMEDVTERKYQEQTLRENEWRNKTISELVTDYVFVVDLEPGGTLNLRWASEAMERLTGHTLADVATPEMWYRLIHPDDQERFGRFVNAVVASEQASQFECRSRRKGDQEHWIQIVAQPKLDEMHHRPVIVGAVKDITERKHAEHALKESENHFRNLFENASIAIFHSTLAGKVAMVNSEFARMFGYESPQQLMALVKDVATDIFADPNRRAEIIRLRNENPERKTFENLYRRKDGSTFLGKLLIQSLFDSDGQLLGFEGFIEDITERKRAEDALRDSEAQLRALIDYSPAAIIKFSPAGNVLLWNAMAEKMYGWTADEALGQIMPTVPPEKFSEKQEFQTRVNQGEVIPYTQVQRQRKDGSTIDVGLSVAPLRDANNACYAQMSISIDITESKRMEKALRESEARFSTAFRASPVPITISRFGDGSYIDLNDTACRFIGYPRAQVIGHSAMDLNLWARPHDRERLIELMRDQGQVSDFETQIRTKTGGIKDAVLAAELLSLDGEDCLLIVINDITERKRSEEQLRYLGTHDTLTGIFNRAFFETELARLESSREFPVSIVVADVDNLKRTNDELGHAAGDALIQRAARALQTAFRASDLITRIGGDEFAVLLPKTDASTADQMLARIRDQLATHNAEQPDLPVRLSLGGATALASHLGDTFKLADARMYEDKSAHKQITEQARYLSTHDALTGIFNHAFFETELSRLEPSREFPVSIVVASVVNLKLTNEKQSQAAGDTLLKRTARAMRLAFRASDIIARIGGNEFAVILPKTDALAVEQSIERVKDNVVRFNAEFPDLFMQILLGTATSTSGKLDATLKVARTQMREDKRSAKQTRH